MVMVMVVVVMMRPRLQHPGPVVPDIAVSQIPTTSVVMMMMVVVVRHVLRGDQVSRPGPIFGVSQLQALESVRNGRQ